MSKISQPTKPVVLVIDDNKNTCEDVRSLLGDRYETIFAHDYQSGCDRILAEVPAAVLLDIALGGSKSGLDILQMFENDRFAPPIVMLTTDGNIDMVVKTIRGGAYHYIHKPPHRKVLLEVVEQAIAFGIDKRRISAMEQEIRSSRPLLTAEDERMRAIVNAAKKMAQSDSSVLITGEPGTGKELLARLIHDQSPRCRGPFVPINGARDYSNLMESDFFGHEKGAFTGATEMRRGAFERASGGTLFLDEIGDCPLKLQKLILRAIQEKQIMRVGGVKDITVDVRIVSATNADTQERLDGGKLRQDFLDRIKVRHLHIPPLRNRPADILGIVSAYLANKASHSNTPLLKLEEEAEAYLLSHPLPGNARKIESMLERAIDSCTGNILSVRHFIEDPMLTGAKILPYKITKENFIIEDSRKYLRMIYKATHGNKKEAAKLAGMATQNLHRLSVEHGIDPNDFIE
jgi:DNA-binding NtrC family response regulator